MKGISGCRLRSFKNGFGLVYRQVEDSIALEYNFIDKSMSLISDKWWCHACHFHEGFARVENEHGMCNHITTEGKILSEKWWYSCSHFHEGRAMVSDGFEHQNYIDETGRLITDIWFRICLNFKDGYAMVSRGTWANNKMNILKRDGHLLFQEWYDSIFGNQIEGVFLCRKNGKMYIMKEDGSRLLDRGWCNATMIRKGYVLIERDDKKKNVIDLSGNIISKRWMDMITNTPTRDGFIGRINGVIYIIGLDGSIKKTSMTNDEFTSCIVAQALLQQFNNKTCF